MNIDTSQALITNPVYIFLAVMCIILLAPLCLNRFKIPHIIGLIVAGIIVGPFGFHILDRDSSFGIFGQVGILYLMFLAGLEIDMFHFKKNLRNGLVFGIYTFIIPLILGIVTSVWILKLNFVTATLLASMYASHTLISYPIVSRFGLSKHPSVVIAITGTIIAVLSSLIVLAAAVSAERTGEFDLWQLFKMLGLLCICLIAIIYSYPRITKWFFKHYHDNVMQFVYIIAMVMLSATLCQLIGIEAILGAFFAGLVLNRYIPAASSLMNRIEFVGNAIFIPYFLIGVGMLINFKLIFSGITTIAVAMVMIIVATSTKWIAAFLTQKHLQLKAVDRKIIFGLSNAHVAAALAAVMIGYEIGVFDVIILNGTILMILASCTIASIVTEQASAKIKVESLSGNISETENTENASNNSAIIHRRRSRVLISVSNPITVGSLVNLAILMRTRNNQNPIFGLHVRNDNALSAQARAENALNIAEEVAAGADVKLTTIDRFDLNTVTGIANTVNERNITDIVMGLHQKSTVVDSFFGSMVEQLVSLCHKTIIISRCFIPLNTVTRIVVFVPPKAEFETGFRYWVIKLCNIASQLGCRIIFCTPKETKPYIRGVIYEQSYEIRAEYREIDDWDDFLLISNRILDDDLFVVVSARRTSISFNSWMDNMPSFLSKYFAHNNLLVIYPEQFGEQPQIITFGDPLSGDINVAPNPLYLKLRTWYRWLSDRKKEITHPERKNRKDFEL
ncbi:MAG: cation:proton antiporter [Muribaculaceae bacterium]|nr:cation:proton antiporter [Muribaculaceae bacterium]